MNKIIISIISVFLFSGSLFSQKVWTLQDCIDYALQNNISVKRKELGLKSSEVLLKETKNNILPDLKFNASQDFNFGRNTDLYTGNTSENYAKSNSFSLSSTITLFSGFRNYHKIKQKELDLTAKLHETEALKDDIKLNILTGYLQILLYEEELQISKNQLKTTELQLENTKLAAEQKILAASDVAEIEAQTSYEKYMTVVSENNLKNAYLQLLKILELQEQQIQIDKPQIEITKNDLILPEFENVYKTSLNLSKVKSAEYQLKSSVIDTKIVKSMLYPEIFVKFGVNTGWSDANFLYDTDDIFPTQTGFVGSLSGEQVYSVGYGTKKYSFPKQIENNIFPAISIGLSYPIFNKFSYKTNIEKAKIKIADTEYFVSETKNQLYFEIRQLYSDIETAIAEYESSKKYLESVKITFENTELKFSVGKITSYDYNFAKNKLIKAESDLLKAKYEIKFKQNILNYYQQLPFYL